MVLYSDPVFYTQFRHFMFIFTRYIISYTQRKSTFYLHIGSWINLTFYLKTIIYKSYNKNYNLMKTKNIYRLGPSALHAGVVALFMKYGEEAIKDIPPWNGGGRLRADFWKIPQKVLQNDARLSPFKVLWGLGRHQHTRFCALWRRCHKLRKVAL